MATKQRLTRNDLLIIRAALCDQLSDDYDSDYDAKINSVLDKIEARLGM